MITWHIGVKDEMKELPLKKGERIKILSEWYKGTENGTEQSAIEITLYGDGSLCFCDENADGIIHLYPEQIKHLLFVLKKKATYSSTFFSSSTAVKRLLNCIEEEEK